MPYDCRRPSVIPRGLLFERTDNFVQLPDHVLNVRHQPASSVVEAGWQIGHLVAFQVTLQSVRGQGNRRQKRVQYIQRAAAPTMVASSTIARIISVLQKSIGERAERKSTKTINGMWVPNKAATRTLLKWLFGWGNGESSV